MGFKWFRARLRMNRVPKNSTGVTGFYRSMSQFDCDVQLPQSSSLENYAVHSIHSIPTSPEPIAYNPMAGLNFPATEIQEVPRDIVSEPTTEWEIGSNVESEIPDDDGRIPQHLPRESIELMRNGSAETSPHQIVARSRKIDFKKKKGKAPIPQTTSNGHEGSEKFITINRGNGSNASEIEI